jgi:hypothetical protein
MTNAATSVILDFITNETLRTPSAAEHNAALERMVADDSLGDYDVVCTTYDQMQTIGGARTVRQDFLEHFSHGGVVLLDESHNAGGAELSARSSGPQLNRANFARTLVGNAHGVFYSSATWAKRPSVTTLYFKTDMRLAVPNPAALPSAIARGGVPLQQVVAAMLAESGQYTRRERSFAGIDYNTVVAPVDREAAERVAQTMYGIAQFDKLKKLGVRNINDDVKAAGQAVTADGSTGGAGATSQNFTSLMHNLIGQMLLSLKVEPTINQAVEALRRGEKVWVGVSNTMGAFLDKYVEDNGVHPGDNIGVTFGDMLHRYLERSRDVSIKDAFGNQVRRPMTDQELGPEATSKWNQLAAEIRGQDWSKLPVSPIDYMRQKIEEAGFRTGEITGRSAQIDYSQPSGPVFRRRPGGEATPKGKAITLHGFNSGTVDALFANRSGSTGLSAHASQDFEDQRRRFMLLAQAELNIDTHMQTLGRTNRTGQITGAEKHPVFGTPPPRRQGFRYERRGGRMVRVPTTTLGVDAKRQTRLDKHKSPAGKPAVFGLPHYGQLVADIPAETRPAAILSKKMGSLSANTTASKDSNYKAKNVPDFMNAIGDAVAAQLMENDPETHDYLGTPLKDNPNGPGLDPDNAMAKVTGRVPMLPLAKQEEIYDQLTQLYNDEVERLDSTGELALEAKSLPLDAKLLRKVEVFTGSGERPFERGAYAEVSDVKRLGRPYTQEQVVEQIRRGLHYAQESSLQRADAGHKPAEYRPADWEHVDLKEAQKQGRLHADVLRGDVRQKFNAYRSEVLDDIEDPALRASKEAQLDGMFSRLDQAIREFPVGTTVSVTSPTGNFYGVVTKLELRGKPKNPVALGSWRFTIAVADAMKNMPVPVSRIDASTGTTAGGAGGYQISPQDTVEWMDPATRKRGRIPLLDYFDHAQSQSREERTIMTGNLLAAYGRLQSMRGQIVNFTDSAGGVRQGILMPRDFSIDTALDEQPVVFSDPDHVVQFLSGGGPMQRIVTSTDGELRVSITNRGNYHFATAASKGRGGTFFLNPAAIAAAGRDFVKAGSYMVLDLADEEKVKAVIRAYQASDVVFHTTTFRPEARRVTGNDLPDNPGATSASPAGGGGSSASARGSRTSVNSKIRNTSSTPAAGVDDVSPLAQRVRLVLRSLRIPVAEKSLSRRLLGVFKHRSENVRVQSLFDVYTAAHEATHAISIGEGIGKRVINDTSQGAPLRKRLTDIYEDFYPRAKRSHPLGKRVEEGLAVLVERYLFDPADVQARYPDLVAAFINPSGKYYDPRFTRLLDGLSEVVGDYAQMSPEQRLGTRVARGPEVARKDRGFTFAQLAVDHLFNKMEPLARYGREAGVSYTDEDPFTNYFTVMSRSAIVSGWLTGGRMAVLRPDGNFEMRDGSVKTYLRMIKGREKQFDTLLVARRTLADWDRIADLQNDAALARAQGDYARAREMEAEAARLEHVLANNDITLQDAATVVGDLSPAFAEPLKVYDRVNRAMIDWRENTGMISAAEAAKFRAERGYASFQRAVDDELKDSRGGTFGSASNQTKDRAMRRRKGSTLQIVSPVFNQMTAINEVVGKGLENVMWRRLYDLTKTNVDIARRFEEVETQRVVDDAGAVSYPQDRDPTLVKVWVGGQRKYFKAAPELIDVAKNLRGGEVGFFADLLRAASNVFTRLTTSANPLFALSNITIDQFTAAAQTKTGYKPGVDPAKSLADYVKYVVAKAEEWKGSDVTGARSSAGAQKFEKYLELGGRGQTYARQFELAPEDAITEMQGGKTLWGHTKHYVDLGLSVLELPSNLSEYMTRYAEFKRALDQGKSDVEALRLAAEVTTPFQLRGKLGGTVGEAWVKSIPYLNAQLQVAYKFWRTVGEQPGRVSTVAAGLATAAAVSALLLLKWLDGDGEARRLFMNQHPSELARALYFPNPVGKGLIRIRIPEQFGTITGLVYLWAIQHYGGNKIDRDALLDVLTASVPDQFNFAKSASDRDPTKQAVSWVPQALKPTIEAGTNTKTYPELGPVVPEYLARQEKAEQYDAYTARVARAIGRALDVSPKKVDFWIREQFGPVGYGLVTGSAPANPLKRQETGSYLAGRAFNEFYQQRGVLEERMKALKGQNSLSKEEARALVETATLYEKFGDVLSNVRRLQQQSDLPDGLKTRLFEVVLELDKTHDPRSLKGEIESVNKEILRLAVESGAEKKKGRVEGFDRVTSKSIQHLLKERRSRLGAGEGGAGVKLKPR